MRNTPFITIFSVTLCMCLSIATTAHARTVAPQGNVLQPIPTVAHAHISGNINATTIPSTTIAAPAAPAQEMARSVSESLPASDPSVAVVATATPKEALPKIPVHVLRYVLVAILTLVAILLVWQTRWDSR